MKRLAALALCLLLMLTALPLAQAEPDVSTVESWGAYVKGLHGGKEINILAGAHVSIDAMQKYYHEFEELTGIKVNWRIITDGTIKNTALIEGSGGTGSYDLYTIDASSMAEFYAKGLIDDIEPFLTDPLKTPAWYDYEDLLPAYRNGIATSKGVKIGIPIAGESRYVGYRTDLFEKYGKEPPKTMEEFLELARFFNGKEEGLYGVSMRAASGRQCGSGFMSVAYAFTDAALVNAKTFEPEFDSPDTVAAVEFYVELLKNAPPDVTTYSHEEALSAFMQGHAAMWLDATALTGRIINPSVSTICDKVDFVPTPTGPKGPNAALAGWNLTIPSDSKNKDAAWAFIVYMTCRPLYDKYIENGGVVCRTSVYEDPAKVAANWTYPRQLEALKVANDMVVERGIAYNPDFAYTGDIMAIAGTYISKAMIEELTVEEACKQAQAEMLDFLADK